MKPLSEVLVRALKGLPARPVNHQLCMYRVGVGSVAAHSHPSLTARPAAALRLRVLL